MLANQAFLAATPALFKRIAPKHAVHRYALRRGPHSSSKDMLRGDTDLRDVTLEDLDDLLFGHRADDLVRYLPTLEDQ